MSFLNKFIALKLFFGASFSSFLFYSQYGLDMVDFEFDLHSVLNPDLNHDLEFNIGLDLNYDYVLHLI